MGRPDLARPDPLAPPFGAYACEILVDQVAMAPPPVPCRVARDPTGPSCPITGNAATDSNLVKWVTVRVYHDGVLRAELSSAILRGMWWRSRWSWPWRSSPSPRWGSMRWR